MRLLVTADLHFNHPRSRALAEELIDRMNLAGGDVLLVVGDTAVADGKLLEEALARFRFAGPRLFVAGNHELWTTRYDSHAIYTTELPHRVRQMGWRWLEDEPFVTPELAIVGSVGWYDYSFAEPALGIPRRFYENKISPGAARQLGEFDELLDESHEDLTARSMKTIARWNDGKFVKLAGRSDEQFLDELLRRLETQLVEIDQTKPVIAAIHHLPFAQLLPPRSARWDFAKAYLGSGRIGELLLKYPNVRMSISGHSHFPADVMVDHIHAVNIGSGYRKKVFRMFEV
jgi:predicted phosphodiesterase